jgi:hypothetical protein
MGWYSSFVKPRLTKAPAHSDDLFTLAARAHTDTSEQVDIATACSWKSGDLYRYLLFI